MQKYPDFDVLLVSDLTAKWRYKGSGRKRSDPETLADAFGTMKDGNFCKSSDCLYWIGRTTGNSKLSRLQEHLQRTGEQDEHWCSVFGYHDPCLVQLGTAVRRSCLKAHTIPLIWQIPSDEPELQIWHQNRESLHSLEWDLVDFLVGQQAKRLRLQLSVFTTERGRYYVAPK